MFCTFCEAPPFKDSFKQILIKKLSKLQQELLQEHAEALRSLHASRQSHCDYEEHRERGSSVQAVGLAEIMLETHVHEEEPVESTVPVQQSQCEVPHGQKEEGKYLGACTQNPISRPAENANRMKTLHFQDGEIEEPASLKQKASYTRQHDPCVSGNADKISMPSYFQDMPQVPEDGNGEWSTLKAEHCDPLNLLAAKHSETFACGDQEIVRHESEKRPQGSTGSIARGSLAFCCHEEIVEPNVDSVTPASTVASELPMRPTWQKPELATLKTRRRRGNRVAVAVNRGIAAMDIRKSRRAGGGSKVGPSLLERASQKCKQEAESRSKGRSCIIHPFTRSWVIWEIVGLIFIIHDIIFVPMQVFELPPNSVLEALEWLTMIYWTVTFFFTFCLSYQSKSGIRLVTDQWTIVIHYLSGWFLLDFFLVGSDWAGVAIESTVSADTSSDSIRNARMARMARIGRIFRTIRLLRIMRIGQMINQVESLIDSEYMSICFLLVCNVIAILFLGHLAACLWFGIGLVGDSSSWIHHLQLTAVPVGEQYMKSLGWSLSTLLGSTISDAFPQTRLEYVYALLVLFVGTIAVSIVFSSTTASLIRLHELRSGERQATYDLKKYLQQNNISTSLEARVIRHVDIAKNVHSKIISSDKVTLLNLLSGPLKLELQLELHAPHLVSHRFFKIYHVTNPNAMGELCLTALNFNYLCRYDTLFQVFTQGTHMYFLVGGVMVYRRAKGARKIRSTVTVDKNNNFCEAVLWTCWIHRGGMKALIESNILALDVNLFCSITESHLDVFLQACDYAVEYMQQINEHLSTDTYIWDVAPELMYPEKYDHESIKGDPGYLKMLKDAHEMSAELLDVDYDSDSDSEDERILKNALACLPTTIGRSTVSPALARTATTNI